MFDFKNILENFEISGSFSDAKVFGSGHINDTFLVKTLGKNQKKYVLQRKNGDIFKNIPGLVNNMKIATEHIYKRLLENNTENPKQRVLSMIPCKNHKYYFIDNENNYWCLYDFIENCKSYNIADTLQKAVYCGEAYGEFIFQLSDLGTDLCIETIPEFHSINMRLTKFHRAVKENIAMRKTELTKEIQFVYEREDEVKKAKEIIKSTDPVDSDAHYA